MSSVPNENIVCLYFLGVHFFIADRNKLINKMKRNLNLLWNYEIKLSEIIILLILIFSQGN
jgi:hypothetical protein